MRTDVHYLKHPGDLESLALATYDLPLSLAFDVALLPLTILAEIVRFITGWPPRGTDRLYEPPRVDPEWSFVVEEWPLSTVGSIQEANDEAIAIQEVLVNRGLTHSWITQDDVRMEMRYGSYAAPDSEQANADKAKLLGVPRDGSDEPLLTRLRLIRLH